MADSEHLESYERALRGLETLVARRGADAAWTLLPPIPTWLPRATGETLDAGDTIDLDTCFPLMEAMRPVATTLEVAPGITRTMVGPWSTADSDSDSEVLLFRGSIIADDTGEVMAVEKLPADLLEAYQLARDRKVSLDLLTSSNHQLAEDVDRFRELMMTDDLTGIHNRRGFRLLADQQLRVARRLKLGLALLYIDVNDLKIINDTWGHKEGDRAIRIVGDALQTSLRDADVVGRIGGDEFAAMVTKSDEFDAVEIIRRVSEGIRAAAEQNGPPFPVSISIGMAHFDPENGVTMDQLIQSADAEMYRNKTSRQRLR